MTYVSPEFRLCTRSVGTALRSVLIAIGRRAHAVRFRTVCIAHTTGAAARRRWRSLRNTGIAVRLSAAFAVVALLAITANLMVLRVSTVKTQTIERLPTELPASPRIAPVPERPVQTESGVLPNRWPPPGPLLAALGDYTSAIDKRAEASTPEAETRLR